MRTTKKDFERFKAEFIRWQDLLGLKDWRVRFHHERLENGVAACVCPDCESRLAGVFYGFICDHAPEEAARHEALELLMSDMEEVARARYIRPDDGWRGRIIDSPWDGTISVRGVQCIARSVVEARHAVIRRLENLLDHIAGARKMVRDPGEEG